MKAVRLVSLIARVALIVTLGLGLLYWIAQLFAWIGLLVFLAQIGFPNIHEGFGTIGVLGLLILGTVAVFTKGSKLLGAGSMLYAFLVPAFGLTQTLILVGALRLYDPGRSLAGRDWSYGAGTKDRETLSAASQTERTGDDFRQRPRHVILCDTPATRNSRCKLDRVGQEAKQSWWGHRGDSWKNHDSRT